MPNMLDWRRQSASFTAMALYRRTSVSFVITVGADGPLRLREGLVGPGFFDLVGAPALIGRPLSNDDFHRAERVVVLSEALWTEQFGRSDSVLGRRLRIDGHDHEVIGVMPRSFQLPTIDTRLWRPLTVAGRWWDGAQSARDGDGFEVIGRLAPGVDIEPARTEMGLIAARLRDAYEVNRDLDIRLSRLADHVVGARDPPRTLAGVRRRPLAAGDRVRERRRPADRPGDAPAAGAGGQSGTRRRQVQADPAASG